MSVRSSCDHNINVGLLAYTLNGSDKKIPYRWSQLVMCMSIVQGLSGK